MEKCRCALIMGTPIHLNTCLCTCTDLRTRMVTFMSHFEHVGISICLLGLKLTIHNIHESAGGGFSCTVWAPGCSNNIVHVLTVLKLTGDTSLFISTCTCMCGITARY